MTMEQLQQKYGDEMVLVIPSSAITCAPNKGPYYNEDEIDFCARKDAVPAFRWRAEADICCKQLVMYAVLRDESGRIFTTLRRGGDGRLVGRYSIGTGGHMQPGETFTEALFRELAEEVGVTPDDMTTLSRAGYILDDSTPVNSVHLGVVWMVTIKDPDVVKVRETEKLSGEWTDADVVATLYQSNSFEPWSMFVLEKMFENSENSLTKE